MTRTFDIRFARNTGLAAWLEASANPFRWKGTGLLSIDEQWFVFSRRRTWPAARPSHRIPAATLSSVYREGEALRLEFVGSPPLVVPIWARDHTDAAEIVRLAPTDRTVEVEASRAVPPGTTRATTRKTGTFVMVAIVSAICGGVINENLKRDAATDFPAAADVAPDAQSRDAVTVSAGVAGSAMEPTIPMPAPRSDFFRAEARALQSDYVHARSSPAELERRWWALSVRLYDSPEFDDTNLRPLIDAQLGVSLNWRASLVNYAEALTSGDRARIESARADLESADELTGHVLSFSQ
jgi:hypothetical protein